MKEPTQFLTNEKGEKIAVVISIEDYQEILEQLEDLEALREFDEAKASGETPVPFDEALEGASSAIASDPRRSCPAPSRKRAGRIGQAVLRFC